MFMGTLSAVQTQFLYFCLLVLVLCFILCYTIFPFPHIHGCYSIIKIELSETVSDVCAQLRTLTRLEACWQ